MFFPAGGSLLGPSQSFREDLIRTMSKRTPVSISFILGCVLGPLGKLPPSSQTSKGVFGVEVGDGEGLAVGKPFRGPQKCAGQGTFKFQRRVEGLLPRSNVHSERKKNTCILLPCCCLFPLLPYLFHPNPSKYI